MKQKEEIALPNNVWCSFADKRRLPAYVYPADKEHLALIVCRKFSVDKKLLL